MEPDCSAAHGTLSATTIFAWIVGSLALIFCCVFQCRKACRRDRLSARYIEIEDVDQTEGESPTEPDAKKEDAITGVKVLPEELEGKSQGLKVPARGTPSELAKSVADDLNADAAAVVG